jgi:hypothetical protein
MAACAPRQPRSESTVPRRAGKGLKERAEGALGLPEPRGRIASVRLFPQFRKPVVQDRNTAWCYRREGDAHSRKFAGVCDSSLGHKHYPVMRDSDRYFRPRRERRRCLNKAAEHAQVLYVSSDLSIAVERLYLHSGHEWESPRAMDLDRNGGTSIFSQQFIPHYASAGRKCQHGWPFSEQSVQLARRRCSLTGGK